MYDYDVIVLGAGPGGYVCAIRLAQLGKKVCVIEKENAGGVCLNKGCIPTKALLESARFIKHIKRVKDFGLEINNFTLDFKRILSRKEEIVNSLRGGIEFLFKQRGIEFIKARGVLKDNHTIDIQNKSITSEFIVIATGSSPAELPNLKFGDNIISSDELFGLEELPKRILIVGGGAIGCEFATILNFFGTEVTLIELMEHILPNEDKEMAKKLQIQIEKQGIKIFTKTRVESFSKKGDTTLTRFSNVEKEEEFETILVCVGRRINSGNIGLEEAGIALNEKGCIVVDEYLKTSTSNIYAIGDVIGGYLLAHVASFEGIRAAENICDQVKKISYKAVPSCVFTEPEFASVGISEEKAKLLGMEIKIGRFPFKSHGKSRILGETEGLIKVIVDKKTNTIAGAQILGYCASELIATLTAFIDLNLKVDDLKDVIFAHPTVSEAIGEAILSTDKSAIHLL